MPLTTYTPGQVLTAASLNDNFAVSGCQLVQASTAFTTVGTVNVNNVFSTAFRYQVVTISITAVSTTLQVLMRMRVGGADNSGASYFMGMNGPNFAADTTLYGPRSNAATSFAITTNSNRDNRIIRLVFDRASDALSTSISGTSASPSDGEVFYIAGTHSVGTAYDGFSLITSTGTITGTYSVSGFTA